MSERPLHTAVQHAIHEFERRWGRHDHTVDMTLWEDRTFQVEVYHIAGTNAVAGTEVEKRLSTLRDADGEIEHREYMWRPGHVAGEMFTDEDREEAG